MIDPVAGSIPPQKESGSLEHDRGTGDHASIPTRPSAYDAPGHGRLEAVSAVEASTTVDPMLPGA